MIDTTNGYGATSTKSSEPPERDRQEYLKPDAGQRAFSYSTQHGASLYLALRFVRSDFNGNCPKQLKRCLEEFPNGDTGASIAKKVLSEANRSGVTNEELFNFILLTRPELAGLVSDVRRRWINEHGNNGKTEKKLENNI